MTPYALTLAKPVPATQVPAYGYSRHLQVNLTATGRFAVDTPAVMAAAGPTYSTAGSKSSADDTD